MSSSRSSSKRKADSTMHAGASRPRRVLLDTDSEPEEADYNNLKSQC